MKNRRNLNARLAVTMLALAGTVWAQQMAPVNPEFLRWEREQAAQGTKTPARGTHKGPAARGTASEDFGLLPSLFDTDYLANINANVMQGVEDPLSSKYDLRDSGWLTTVKDQGDYGNCWAFAALGSLESAIKKASGSTEDFSENHLANLHGFSLGYGDGGNGDMAEAYLLRWEGPVDERDDAYPRPDKSVVRPAVRHTQHTRWIARKTGCLDNDTIKRALMKYGALNVSYYHASGYYNAKTASYYRKSTSRTSNHAVLLVGWDDNYSKTNFLSTPPGNGAYLVRNSWGTGWGKQGFFHVSYYDDAFAWNTLYGFADVEGPENYDGVYQYDPLGRVGAYGVSWGANMFAATNSSKVAAVGFYAMTPRTSYSLQVYTGCTEGQPCSGTLVSQKSGTLEEAGYTTVPLEKPAAVKSRERFSVVLQLTTPGYYYPLAVEYAYPGYSSKATAKAGQSFWSRDGKTWSDFTTTVASTANFCCKAYVKSDATPEKALSGLSIGGVNSLQSGRSAQFSCTATYTDGSSKTVKPVWSMADGAQWASVSASGLVTAAEVEEQQTATVQARYEEEGVSVSSSWTLYVTAAAPGVPTGLTASAGTEESCVRLSWNAKPGASSYAVYRGMKESSVNAAYLGTVTVPRYADTAAKPGVDYRYFVKAKNDSGSSAFSEGAWGWRALAAPDRVSATDGRREDCVAVSWVASDGAEGYQVQRKGRTEAEWGAITGWMAECRYEDKTAVPGEVYAYRVIASVDGTGARASAPSVADDGWRQEPFALKSLSISGPASLSSGDSAEYTCAAVYTDGTSKPVKPVWTLTGGTSTPNGDGVEVQAPVVGENTVMVLTAEYAEGITVAVQLGIAVTPLVPAVPSGVRVEPDAAAGILTVGWNAVDGATRYLVDRRAEGTSAETIGTTTATSFVDSTAEPGVEYTYRVSSANAAGTSDPSEPGISGFLPIAAPASVWATSGKRSESVTVTWTASKGATHYRVSRADSAESDKTALGGWREALSFDDASAEAGVTYQYFVQGAADGTGKAASAFGGPAAGMRLAPLTPSSLAIYGPTQVLSGSSATYTAKVRYADGYEENVLPTWSLGGASGMATIGSDGVLRVGSLAENTPVVLHASYTDGMTVEASLDIMLAAPIPAKATILDVVAHARWPWNGWVDVDYALAIEPKGTLASVSLSGWDGDHRAELKATTMKGEGADGLLVASGKHRISWNLGADYPEFHAKDIRIAMDATPSEEKNYIVVDLSGGTASEVYPVTYLAAPPEGGFNTDEYKTEKLVLRRIGAGTFMMGSPTNELGRQDIETQHEVTISKRFYMGVFEVTQRQWELTMGSKPSYFRNESCYAKRPVEQVSYYDIRGEHDGYKWPSTNSVDASSFLGVLRAKTGLEFDLPTEAQWEYACRAGANTALNSGQNLTGTQSCPNMAEVGRYRYNGGENDSAWCDTSSGTAEVGSYKPNTWGLYDMHGNVSERCLDWWEENCAMECVTDPVGPLWGKYRVIRSGGWSDNAQACRSATRGNNDPLYGSIYCGLRLACSIGP